MRTSRFFRIWIFLTLIAPQLSWGVEYLRDEEPYPDSVEELHGPLAQAFEKVLPQRPLFPRLRNILRNLPDPFRDSHFDLNVRTHYFNRENTNNSHNEAWAMGGSLAYQSGWYRDLLSLGGEVFTSQKFYGLRSRDGTLLLRPRQLGYTVLGRAYGKLKYKGQEASLYRQYYNLPYVNKQKNRMTPSTFEGYSLRGQLAPFRYIAGYISRIKRRDSSTFVSMSEAAGVQKNRKRGLILAGAVYEPTDDFRAGAITYFVPDVFNTVYAGTEYTWSVTNELGMQLSAQFTDQRSVGAELLGLAFATQTGGTQAALSYRNIILRSAFSITADGAKVRNPYGGYPGYVSLMISNFNRADEKAWLIGLSYDCKRIGLPGLSFYTNYAQGYDARNATSNESLPDEEEFDITFDYRVEDGPLRGLWFRSRWAYFDFASGGGSRHNVRLIVNYDLSIL